jgi:hypothetical protein
VYNLTNYALHRQEVIVETLNSGITYEITRAHLMSNQTIEVVTENSEVFIFRPHGNLSRVVRRQSKTTGRARVKKSTWKLTEGQTHDASILFTKIGTPEEKAHISIRLPIE